jgi:glutamyl-tRNA reductase
VNEKLFVAGLSYKTAPVEVREKLAIHPSHLRCFGCRLKVGGNLSEVVLLSTCNRVEIYGVTPWINGKVHKLFQVLSGTSDFDFSPYIYVKEGDAAVQHLFSVVGGLDSMVIGETEITGQVKQAYTAAQEAKLTGKYTNRWFQTALQTAKEIRTQTGIGRGATSVGSVAVELAEKIFDKNLSKKTVMIIGAGKMGEATIKHLAKRGAQSVLVSNRSYDRALNLANEFGGRAVRYDECLKAMCEADIVVSSTGSPDTILSREDVAGVMRERGNRPLFMIDIAVPRDIDADVQQIENVYLYNVDHLENLVRANVANREQELLRCQEIVSERAAELLARFAPKAPVAERPSRPVASEPEWIFAGAACAS